jgi:hypothetical protein
MRASEAKGPFPGGKRVGSRGKKKKEKGEGRAPADLHPPLIVDKGVWPLRQAQGLRFLLKSTNLVQLGKS